MALLQNTTNAGTRTSEVVLSGGGSISREKGFLISGQNLKAGAVLGVITASGKYTLHDAAAADGSQTAAGVLLADCNAVGGDQPALVLARLADVKTDLLVFKAGITAPQRTAALAALAGKFLIAR